MSSASRRLSSRSRIQILLFGTNPSSWGWPLTVAFRTILNTLPRSASPPPEPGTAGRGLIEHGPEDAQVRDDLEEFLEADGLDHVGIDPELVALEQVPLL